MVHACDKSKMHGACWDIACDRSMMFNEAPARKNHMAIDPALLVLNSRGACMRVAVHAGQSARGDHLKKMLARCVLSVETFIYIYIYISPPRAESSKGPKFNRYMQYSKNRFKFCHFSFFPAPRRPPCKQDTHFWANEKTTHFVNIAVGNCNGPKLTG